jgi:uncharacterized linocin/CFP29 family protein
MVNGPYILPPEFYMKAKAATITAARQRSIVRDLVSVQGNLGGIGVQNWSWSKQGTMSEAQLSWSFTQTGEDQISLSRESTRIPVLHKEFKLDYRDLAAAQMNGYPLSMKNITEATYKVANLENKVILDGYNPKGTSTASDYEVKGLYQSAGNEITDNYDFGTYGKATDAVAAARELFIEDEVYGPYNLIINEIQGLELQLSEHASYANPEKPKVEGLLGGGRIIETPFMPAGKGLLVPTKDAMQAEMLITQDMTLFTEVEAKSRDFWGQIYECVTLAVYEPNSICRLTTI